MVRGRTDSPKVGIFEEGTHQIVDIPRCVVHHPLVNEVAFALKQAMKATRTSPYSDTAHAGLVRALQVVVERSSQSAQVTLVVNADDARRVAPLLELLRASLGSKLHSLWFNAQTERTNTILGRHFEHICGPDFVEDEVGGARAFFPPDAFGQANPTLMDDIVAQIHGWVPPGSRVLELYAGVGAIGLGLLRRGDALTFNEIGTGSLNGLRRGIAQVLAEPPRAGEPPRVSVLPGPADSALVGDRGDDVVIVDPPRKGLGPDVRRGLAALSAPRLIYLSCGLDSFLGDARELSRHFALRQLVAYGLFPYTEHVETLALFERK
jgi:tRNA/tmRNA/rRNA uracil-C5-methylase (TrmA/RlmC/RlmD family)